MRRGGYLVNNKRIESLGVSELESFINRHELLQAYVDKNDKTPAWDGEIHVLKAPTEKKSDIFGKVPVQIKTTQRSVEKLASFPLNINDLILYKKHGGIVLFVISLDSERNLNGIYYKSLPPLSIKRLIKESRTKKTINVKIHPITKDSVYAMLMDFLKNSSKQFSFYDSGSLSIEQAQTYSNLKFYSYGKTPTDIFKYQKEHDLFAYVTDKNTGAEFPIQYPIEITAITTKTDLTIKIGNSTFSNDITRQYLADGTVELIIGSGFKLSANEATNTFTLHYSRPYSLSEAIISTRAILDLQQNGYFIIDDIKVDFSPKQLSNIDTVGLTQQLNELEELSSFMLNIGVTKDIDLTLFDEQSKKHFHFLNKGLILKETVSTKHKESQLMHLRVANAHFLVLWEKTEEGVGNLINIFETPLLCRAEEYNGDLVDMSVFDIPDANAWLKIDNIDFDEVMQSYVRLEKSPKHRGSNNAILNLISAYDLSEDKNRKKQLLDWAMKLSEWNVNHFDDKKIAVINDLQIKARQRQLEPLEIEKLHQILVDNIQDQEIGFAVNTLLSSKTQAEYYWRKFDKVLKETYAKLPIYCLFKKLLK